MKNPMPNSLTIMSEYERAYRKGYCLFGSHGNTVEMTDGWIPNTFWADALMFSVLDGMRENRKLIYRYRQYFEKLTSAEYMDRYPAGIVHTNNKSIVLSRIVPSKREEWKEIVAFKREQWLKQKGKI
jgi:hypothetical protein